MGRANRERRRMKEKARKRTYAERPGGGSNGAGWVGDDGWNWLDAGQVPPPNLHDRVAALIDVAVHGSEHHDDVAVTRIIGQLTDEDAPGWRRAVERGLDDCVMTTIGALWRGGWQPVDLLRVAARRLTAHHQHVLSAGIAAELARYAPTTVDPRWSAQLVEGQVEIWWPTELTAVQACARAHRGGWADFVVGALELLHLLVRLPILEILGPPPGAATAAPSRPGSAVDERILTRVRALLAKAESTPYPAEAETFTAGAQALMARHSIDHALLAASGRAPADRPTGRRIGVDNPYEAPKAGLLDAIASANRCRAIWSKELGFCTVVGYPTDLDTVEVIFTSLLVQAITAMTREGSRTDRSGRSRTRTFRQSFLLSYSVRIRERLTETTRQQTDDAAAEPGGSNLLPVLASRADAVDDAMAKMFPHLTKSTAGSAWDHEGWASGRAAADLASINPAAHVTGR